jgi:hypothetical protein
MIALVLQRVHMAEGQHACQNPARIRLSSKRCSLGLARDRIGRPSFLQRRARSFARAGRATPDGADTGLPLAHQSAEAAGNGMQPRFQWTSAVCSRQDLELEGAVAQAVQEALAGWPPGAAPDLALVFVSSNYHKAYERLLPALRRRLPSLRHVLGCTVSGGRGQAWWVLAAGQERAGRKFVAKRCAGQKCAGQEQLLQVLASVRKCMAKAKHRVCPAAYPACRLLSRHAFDVPWIPFTALNT